MTTGRTLAEATRVLTEYLDLLERAEGEGPRQLQKALDDPPRGVGVHEIDRDARVLRVNAEELRVLGYREQEIVGRQVWEIIVMQEAAQRAIGQKIRGERELKPFVRTFRRADGTAIVLMLADRLLRDGNGEPSGLRTALTELSEAAPPR
jgi:PAS domain S-box-containing protein